MWTYANLIYSVADSLLPDASVADHVAMIRFTGVSGQVTGKDCPFDWRAQQANQLTYHSLPSPDPSGKPRLKLSRLELHA